MFILPMVRQEAASLALCVRGQVGQIIEEAPGVVFVMMQDAMGGGAYRGVRKAGLRGNGSWREFSFFLSFSADHRPELK